MTPLRYKTAFDAQPAIARKLFDFVPIQDAWPVNKIIGEMVRGGIARIDLKTAEGCMNKLKDAGLVKEPDRGVFQRVVPREREAPKLEICPTPTPAPILGNSQDASAQTTTAPTVVFGELAMTLRHQASLLNKIADTIDQSALEFEDRIEVVEKRMSRFRELSALLKEF